MVVHSTEVLVLALRYAAELEPVSVPVPVHTPLEPLW
jgi:hypothetical protein